MIPTIAIIALLAWPHADMHLQTSSRELRREVKAVAKEFRAATGVKVGVVKANPDIAIEFADIQYAGLYFPAKISIAKNLSGNRVALRNVLRHELGHAFGLQHSSNPSTVMFRMIGVQVERKLQPEDVERLRVLYPSFLNRERVRS